MRHCIAAASLAGVASLAIIPKASAATVAYFQFNQNGGSTVTDSVGGYTATLTGFADTAASYGDTNSNGWLSAGGLGFSHATSNNINTNLPMSSVGSGGWTMEFVGVGNGYVWGQWG